MQYDDAKNQLTQTDVSGEKTRYEYTPFGQIERVYLVDKSSPNGLGILLSFSTYDSQGRLVSQKEYNDVGGVENETFYTYDTFNRVTRKSIRS